MKHAIFIGAPGSGKGTQAAKLVSDKGYKHISTGDLLRAEIAKATELGKKVKDILSTGSLVSDDLVIQLLKANTDLDAHGYIFDGYPRNLAQAQTLDHEVIQDRKSFAIYFKIDLPRLIGRLTNRRTCKSCGAIYNLITNPLKSEGVCDVCGGHEIIHRDDDREDVIKNRMDVFVKNIEPVLEYYRNSHRLIELDAEKSIEYIFNKISSCV